MGDIYIHWYNDAKQTTSSSGICKTNIYNDCYLGGYFFSNFIQITLLFLK